jgi:hypothetical protein
MTDNTDALTAAIAAERATASLFGALAAWLEPVELDREIAAMPTEEIEAMLAAEKIATIP